jgi:excisionase family DNA binding protein
VTPSQSNRRTGEILRAYSGPKGRPGARPVGIAMGVKDEPSPRPEDDAHLLAVSKATVYRLALSGEIASARGRGCFRLRREAMDDFVALAEQTVMPKTAVTAKAHATQAGGCV